jgi:osmotically-inducible protein OsmY
MSTLRQSATEARQHKVPDRVLKRLLVADLQEEPRTRGERIRVDVRNGVVVLHGVVSSAMTRHAARLHARSLPGVRDVSDQLVERSLRPAR